MKTLLLLFLTTLPVLAQPWSDVTLSQPVAASAPAAAWTVTNAYPEYVKYWWDSTYYNTNAGTVFLPDVWTNSLHLTNATAAAFPTGNPTGSPSGRAIISWDSDMLRSISAFQNSTAPSAWIFVMRYDDTGNTAQQRMKYNDNASGVIQSTVTTRTRSPWGATFTTTWADIESLWLVWVVAFDSSTTIGSFTNQISEAYANAVMDTANSALGFGGRFSDGAAPMKFSVAEMGVLTNVNQYRVSASITNLVLSNTVYQLAAKHGITLP